MKVVLPVDGKNSKNISKNFGRSPFFLLIDGDKITYLENESINQENGAGIKTGEFIIGLNPEAIIVPKLGEKSSKIFKLTNIKVYKSKSDDVYENLDLLKANNLDLL